MEVYIVSYGSTGFKAHEKIYYTCKTRLQNVWTHDQVIVERCRYSVTVVGGWSVLAFRHRCCSQSSTVEGYPICMCIVHLCMCGAIGHVPAEYKTAV